MNNKKTVPRLTGILIDILSKMTEAHQYLPDDRKIHISYKECADKFHEISKRLVELSEDNNNDV